MTTPRTTTRRRTDRLNNHYISHVVYDAHDAHDEDNKKKKDESITTNGLHDNDDDDVITPTMSNSSSTVMMSDNELDKAYHNLGMAAETLSVAIGLEEKDKKLVMGGIDVDGGLSSGRGLIGKYPIGWEARIIHMEEKDRVHKEKMRAEQKEREKRILARYELEKEKKAEWKKTMLKSVEAKEIASRQVHFKWRQHHVAASNPTTRVVGRGGGGGGRGGEQHQIVESGKKGRVMVILDKRRRSRWDDDDDDHDTIHTIDDNEHHNELTPENILDALFEYVSMFEGVQCVTELSNAVVVATFHTPQQAQQCILVSQDNADIQVTRAATAAVTQGPNVRKVNPVVRRRETERLGSGVVGKKDKSSNTPERRGGEVDTLSSSSHAAAHHEDNRCVFKANGSSRLLSPSTTTRRIASRSLNTTTTTTSGRISNNTGTQLYSAYQIMVSNTIKDDLINRGLWNNAKYWSKFGEMLDIGLPVEDSYQMAKEYMDTLNNKESSRRHHAKRVPGKADDKKSNIEDEEVGECPVCGKTGIPLIDLQRHVNDCLQ